MEKHRQSSSMEIYPIPGIEYGRLLLEVPSTSIDIPLAVKSFASQSKFKLKEEYHVTVVGKKTQERLLAVGILDEVVEILKKVPQWHIISLGDILLLRNVEIDDKGNQVTEESIIQLATLSGLNDVYDVIRETTNLDIPTPPVHITLFTKNADRGIGLYSTEQLAQYTVQKLA